MFLSGCLEEFLEENEFSWNQSYLKIRQEQFFFIMRTLMKSLIACTTNQVAAFPQIIIITSSTIVTQRHFPRHSNCTDFN